VQLRHGTALTSDEYVRQEGWRQASLDRCPLHARGGCGLARHGSYRRVRPAGMRIARWYCPTARTTFSLLPDCLASRLSGGLDAVEEVVAAVEDKLAQGASIEVAADQVRPNTDEGAPDIGLPSAVRWVRRRLAPVHRALLALVTLLPGRLGGQARVLAVRRALATPHALVRLRQLGAAHLAAIEPPLGFGRRTPRRCRRRRARQHKTGPDPPRPSR
jgi:hypothetical protein